MLNCRFMKINGETSKDIGLGNWSMKKVKFEKLSSKTSEGDKSEIRDPLKEVNSFR